MRPAWFAAIGLLSLGACAGEAPCPATGLEQIGPGVYLRPGKLGVVFEADDLANLGVVVGTDAVAVIDSGGSPAEGEALLCAIRQITELPITHLINTHVHPDHVFGNRPFIEANPDLAVVGHRNLQRATAMRSASYVQNANAVRASPWQPEQVIVPPNTAPGDDGILRVDLGGRELIVTAHPTAHTDSDLSVLDTKSRTLFTGDLLFRHHLPVVDGSINGWIGVLESWLRSASPALVVPGHGPVSESVEEAFRPNLAYLSAVRKEVRAAVARGDSIDRAQSEAATEATSGWELADHYHQRNVAAAYVELEWE
ncbi:MAG: quinoprotein relay system zinc metallohydrolase 2 [Pseudomonadota bacterium]